MHACVCVYVCEQYFVQTLLFVFHTRAVLFSCDSIFGDAKLLLLWEYQFAFWVYDGTRGVKTTVRLSMGASSPL